ncbi:hypothetical protein E1I18_03350 [Mycoplasmopsis mucosicanis]|uniref:Uncharacterized protein n=1 Tax=Mycoplasmopsis mucosicanis TaxID=458208 RepID=A0A507SM14_9BACT|nr:hypothetical protein [Mycoplasmopsis mucosicanis]TQC51305.1 hypothetical protein E1I18_03350 [Mycoplasmopsis mucosicanis]
MDQSDLDRISLVHWIIFVVFSVVFCVCILFSSSLIIGYVIGASVSFLIYMLRVFFSLKLLLSKRAAFGLSTLNFLCSLTLIGCVLAIIIMVNKFSNNTEFNAYRPINIFTFCFGINNIPLAILITFVLKSKNKRKGAHGRNN